MPRKVVSQQQQIRIVVEEDNQIYNMAGIP
jgi:hypothetical protein